MRIDEIDNSHKEFKKIILNHDLSEQELLEVGFLAPAIAGAGRFALQRALPAIGRGAMGAVRGIGRGIRGLGKGISRGVGYGLGSGGSGGSGGQSMVSKIGGAVTQAGDAIRDLGTDLSAKNTGRVDRKNNNQAGNRQSMKTDTAAKLSQQGGGPSQTIGTQPTSGTQGTQGTQGTDQLKRGSEVKVPVTKPGDPNKTIPADMKVKNVTGSEIELEPAKRGKGLPKTVKYDKKDLQFL
jgi:hypothetical protein